MACETLEPTYLIYPLYVYRYYQTARLTVSADKVRCSTINIEECAVPCQAGAEGR
jgi:hypothetical protein